MTAYLTVIVLEFIIYAISINFKQEQQNKVFLTLGAIPIILLTALRARTVGGYDPINYYNNYILSQNLGWKEFVESTPMEEGYLLFVKTLSSVFKDPQWLFFWMGLICTSCVMYFIYKNSKDPFLSVILYFTLDLFTFSLSGFRQALAMSICLLSVEFIKKRRFVWFVALVLLASQIHIMALVFLLLYFVGNIKINALNILIMIGISGIVIYLIDDIVGFANYILETTYHTAVSSGGYITVVIYFLMVAMVLLYNKELLEEKTNGILVIMMGIGLLTYIMRYYVTRASERISFFFFFSIIVLLPNLIYCIKDKKERKTLYLLTIIFAVALFVYRAIGSTIYPYKFFWNI